MVPVYPERGRTGWILARRPARNTVPDPERAHGVFLEDELLASGRVGRSGVILLTNKECPWRCVMCDLWKETTVQSVPPGAIPRQIGRAVQSWREAGDLPAQVKLYNSGSFFDPAAIPPEDVPAIAAAVGFAEQVIVESHPLLIGPRAVELRDLLPGPLEVAIGLETAHPGVLKRLNKRFDLSQFERAANYLRAAGIGLRVFLLVNPPFMEEQEGLAWTVKSAELAFSCGAGAVTLIPTRPGNGAMDRLRESGEFVPPKLSALEQTLKAVLALGGGRVFADVWDLAPFSSCPHCFAARCRRLEAINLTQQDRPAVGCPVCGGA